MIDAHRLALMGRDAVLANAARWSTRTRCSTLAANRIGGAALDV